jgi:prepilin-type N-terminal cleavage/methylation domain-containing protein
MIRLRRRLGRERGYSLVEMLVVLSIMSTVMAGLTTLFVQGSNAELDMNNRFQAQLNARLALDKIRREVHCGSVATPAGQSSLVVVTLPSYCKTGSGSITWCTKSLGTNRWGLYRIQGAPGSCTGGVKWADYLTATSAAPASCTGFTSLCVFTYSAQSTTSLAKMHVDFPVNVKPSKTVELYELSDDIVLRNSSRS